MTTDQPRRSAARARTKPLSPRQLGENAQTITRSRRAPIWANGNHSGGSTENCRKIISGRELATNIALHASHCICLPVCPGTVLPTVYAIIILGTGEGESSSEDEPNEQRHSLETRQRFAQPFQTRLCFNERAQRQNRRLDVIQKRLASFNQTKKTVGAERLHQPLNGTAQKNFR